MASVQRPIKIYARIKPFTGSVVPYEINHSTKDVDEEILTITALRNSYDDHHFVNNKPETYKFRFSHVFDTDGQQDHIFNEVARPVAESALSGYNGTIFAYGQTGTGKTWTITGSRCDYEQRGIIPRTLQYIFKRFQDETGNSKINSVFISYLEIYNEIGYDLLHTSELHGGLEDLAKVTILEDANQQMHLKNLSVHPVESVAEATQLLYVGDHNRSIAETPFNETSTRSHCIFTIHLNIRDTNSSIVRRSKVHLVDLAGSERVSNSTSVTGQLFNEARHINLALHYLEQVIVALGDSGRQHIPYRNSMMTSLLRDSLGGNCMTSMIATLSMEAKNLQESLSTNRFAQRVALVTNSAILNEELDPNLVIAQLKSEVKRLKETIGSASVKPIAGEVIPLTNDEHMMCETLVEQFLHDVDKESILPIFPDMRLIQECFRLLKEKAGETPKTQISKIYGNTKLADETSMAQLVARREAEIKVLMSMLRKEKFKNKQTRSNATSSESLALLPSDSKANTSVSDFVLDELLQQDDIENDFEPVARRKPEPVVQKKSKSNITIKQSHPNLRNLYSVEEEALLDGLTGMKKEAIGVFMKTYTGTETLSKVRTSLLQTRSEIRSLENAIGSQRSSMVSLQGIMATAADPSKIQEAFQSQQRTCQMQEERLDRAKQRVTELETALKTHFRFLLDDFEIWWTKHHRNMRNDQPSSNTNQVDDEDGESLFSLKNVDFLAVGVESPKSQAQAQVETKKTKKVNKKSPKTRKPKQKEESPKVTPRHVSKAPRESPRRKLRTSSYERGIKLVNPGNEVKTQNKRKARNLSANSEINISRTAATTNFYHNDDTHLIESVNRVLPKIIPVDPLQKQVKKLGLTVPNIPLNELGQLTRMPGTIRVPRKELFYTPGQIKPAPQAPPVSPVSIVITSKSVKQKVDNIGDSEQIQSHQLKVTQKDKNEKTPFTLEADNNFNLGDDQDLEKYYNIGLEYLNRILKEK